MKVLYITHYISAYETDAILALKNKGVDVYVVTGTGPGPYYSKLESAGIPIEHLAFKSRFDRATIRRIREIMLSFKPDIAHTFSSRTTSIGLIASKGLPVKIIAYRGVVDNISLLSPGAWMTYFNPRVARIICVSNASRNYILDLRFLWLRAPTHKIVAIHKGHDMAWYRKPPYDLSEFGIKKGDFVICCVANYRPRKGVEYLIEAISLLPNDCNIHLLLVGEMQHKSLLQSIRHSQYPQRIHFAGYRTHDAPQVQAACDICALPAIRPEGLPRAVIEGMAYGLPAIVTDAGGSLEIVEHNVSGLVVKPRSAEALADAILRLYSNPQLRAQMGAAARKRIETDFNIETTINKTFTLYQEVLANDQPSTNSVPQ